MSFLTFPGCVKFEVDEGRMGLRISVFEQVYEVFAKDAAQFQGMISLVSQDNASCGKVCNLEDEFTSYLIENNLAYVSEKGSLPLDTRSGIDFYTYLYNLVQNKWIVEAGETKVAIALSEPEKHYNLVLGWTLEYFHVTRLAVTSLMPILVANMAPKMFCLAKDFILEEMYHEQIMAKAFQGTGISEQSLYSSNPLPTTVAYMDFLRELARKRPHSFFASLFFYEEDEDQMEYALEIPENEIFKNIRFTHVSHAKINQDGGHSDVSKEYFSSLTSFSKDEQEIVLNDMRQLFYLYQEQQSQAYEYYCVQRHSIEERL